MSEKLLQERLTDEQAAAITSACRRIYADPAFVKTKEFFDFSVKFFDFLMKPSKYDDHVDEIINAFRAEFGKPPI